MVRIFERFEIPSHQKLAVDSGAKTSIIRANNIKVYTKGAPPTPKWVSLKLTTLSGINRGHKIIEC